MIIEQKYEMITIYHNPRCAKSREVLNTLENMNKPYQLRLYLTEPFTKNELTDVIHKLDILPIELIRTKESIWIENFKKKQLSDLELMDIILKYPKLIERPIVVNGKKAVIARPVAKLNHLNL